MPRLLATGAHWGALFCTRVSADEFTMPADCGAAVCEPSERVHGPRRIAARRREEGGDWLARKRCIKVRAFRAIRGEQARLTGVTLGAGMARLRAPTVQTARMVCPLAFQLSLTMLTMLD